VSDLANRRVVYVGPGSGLVYNHEAASYERERAVSYDEPTFEEVDQHAQALAEIERLRAALANEQARGVHTCHEHCERPMCVMQRAITERDSTIERLRARLGNVTAWRDTYQAEIERLRAALAEAERLLRKAAKTRHPSVVSDLIGAYFAKEESRE
jgi:septal ring factor EnvC (AmiA/AmiB activator)